MYRLIPAKYILFAIASAFFLGCFLYSIKFISIYIILPLFVLVCLLAFLNRRLKNFVIIPILVIVMLFGALEYHQTAGKQSTLLQFIGRAVVIEGVVAEDPIPTEYGAKLLLKNVYYIQNNKMYKCNEKVLLYIGKDDRIQFGDQVRIFAEVEPVAKLRNFGDFNFESYYKSKNIHVKAFSIQINKLAANNGGLVASILHNCNQKVKSTIFSALPQNEAALLYGILTGSKSEIDQDVMQVFSETGLAHILSVSGLHVGFLVLLLTFLLKPFKLNNRLHSIIVFIIVLLYIIMIGAPVPAVRALLMLAVMLVGKILSKKYDLNTSASSAAILLLVYNPLFIHDPSFIISFACIYSISFFHEPINKILYFLPSWLRSSLALSAAVWIGIAPVLIHYFNYISIINVFLNVLAVPIAFLITLAGFIAVIIGFVFMPISIFIFAATYYLLKLLYFISEKSLLLPFAGFSIPTMGWYIYLIYYLGIITLIEDFWKYKSRTFKKNYFSLLGFGLCIILFLSVMPRSVLKIYFVDVGQGDCSVIRTPNHKTIVVDGGGSGDWEKSSFDVGKKLTVPALQHIGIWNVDTVVVSHIHDDHLGGVLSILESFRVKQVVLPVSDRYGEGEFSSVNYERLKAFCKAKNIPIKYIESNSSISVGKDIFLKVLSPIKPFIHNTDSDVNNNSLVFMLSYKGFDALFTGDIQQEAEQQLLNRDIRCDVLKVAHHGSPYSTTQGFLESSDPEISIISVGKNNYGHPAKEVIERLKEADSQIYRIDMSGAVMLDTDGKQVKIRTVR